MVLEALRQFVSRSKSAELHCPIVGVLMDLCVPDEFEEILELLPGRLSLRVPRDVLHTWFSGKHNIVDQRVLDIARTYARSCGCLFRYDEAAGEGLFLKRSLETIDD